MLKINQISHFLIKIYFSTIAIGCSSGRSIKEQWMVPGGDRGRLQEDALRYREGGRVPEDPTRWRDVRIVEEQGRWREGGRGVDEQISSSQVRIKTKTKSASLFLFC